MKNFKLSRRTLLRGMGALMALPVLEQMKPSVAWAAEPGAVPRRLAVFYVPCGIYMPNWTPKGTGRSWTLSPTLQPLAPVKDDLLVLSGLSHEPGRPDRFGHHAAGTGAFLSCVKVNYTDEMSEVRAGISMDQIAAKALRTQTRLPSLELGNDGGDGTGSCDANFSCAYARNISWAGPTSPRAKETNPQAVFDRLFASFDPDATRAQIERRKAYEQSILDFVNEDARALKQQLGTRDQRKLDEYFTSVRELELRVAALDQQAPTCSKGPRPERTQDVREKTKVMCDLMVLAFQCDLTRVATFMLGNGRSDRVYDFLGLTSGHHTYSHHQHHSENHAALAKIDRWELEQFSYLLQRMKSVQEGEATLLDNSLVYFGSEVADGNSHGHSDMPVVLAGRGGGAVTPGRHVRYGGRPIANLFISMLGAVGVDVDRFGDDGTGPLSQLKE
ncbi:DUF1552 domain-containing protein [Archangium lansingense]|uniref:DUF1552 domain-containing protein n=1 Tax=Archangium lansingense TaxID=2995310 RepID=A0ABT4AM22_9BACT|nr:DUF1552 domain-containing protein [Archangium lansinium]MCY1082730.1 DUF1552 domain-containing protein [Archangium lansinium]